MVYKKRMKRNKTVKTGCVEESDELREVVYALGVHKASVVLYIILTCISSSGNLRFSTSLFNSALFEVTKWICTLVQIERLLINNKTGGYVRFWWSNNENSGKSGVRWVFLIPNYGTTLSDIHRQHEIRNWAKKYYSRFWLFFWLHRKHYPYVASTMGPRW